MEIYVVQPGDSVDAIAEKMGADVASMIDTNQLVYPYRLAVGQALLIYEDGEERPDPARRVIYSNGYAYPFISPWVLSQTLPYLSELSVFSYGFTENGDLLPPALDDRWMVEDATRAGTSATLTLTPLGADGRFNNRLVSAVVNRVDVQLVLLRNLVGVMAEKGYDGLNIDFEYILGQDRDAFTAFVGRATRLLNQFGYYVTVALAPKYTDDQPGVLYEGMDYAGLGQAANSVLLMTYEWGYTYNLTRLW